MPDLTIEVMQMCSSFQQSHTASISSYQQVINREQNHYDCTCSAFKYRRNRDSICKHLRQLEASLCIYHELIDGPPEVDGVCPNCGKPTVYVRVAV